MIKTTGLSKAALIAILLLIATISEAAPEFDWLAAPQSETRRVAEGFFAQSEIPDEQTRVLYKSDIQIDGDTVTERIKIVRFYSTQSDIEQQGNGEIYWDQEVEKLRFREAGVLSPDNRYQRFDAANLRVLDDDGYNTFTNNKKVVMPFSGLRAGDVSLLEYELTYKLSQLESGWAQSYYPITLEDTQQFELAITSNSITLNTSVIGDRFKCVTDPKSVRCSGDNLTAYEADSGVIWRDVIDQIYVSAMSDWDEVITQSLAAFNKAELESEIVDSLLERLTASASSMEDKISRIHEYVAREIRYVSLSELGHRVTPHTVASVEKNRFGDCKDKTAVLVALLRKLELEAYPVLVATKRDDPSRLVTPSVRYFDHMIACFTYQDKPYCIDGTDADTSWQTISTWIQGAAILPLIAGQKPGKLRFEQPRWVVGMNTQLIFDETGKQKEKLIRHFYNSYAGDLRGSYRPMSDKEKSESARDQYHRWISDSVMPTFVFKESDSIGHIFSIESSAEYEPFMDVEDDLSYTERDHWLRYELIESKLKTEHYDTEFDGLYAVSEVLLDVSAAWNATRLPSNLNLEGRFGKMTRTAKHTQSDQIEVKTILNIPRQAVSQADIESFNDFLELLARESSINVLGKTKSTAPKK